MVDMPHSHALLCFRLSCCAAEKMDGAWPEPYPFACEEIAFAAEEPHGEVLVVT